MIAADQEHVKISSVPFFLYPENLEFFVGRSNHPVVEGEKPWRKLLGLTLLAFLILFAFELFWHGGYVSPSGPPLQIALIGSALVFVGLFSYFHWRHRTLLSKGTILEGRVLAMRKIRLRQPVHQLLKGRVGCQVSGVIIIIGLFVFASRLDDAGDLHHISGCGVEIGIMATVNGGDHGRA